MFCSDLLSLSASVSSFRWPFLWFLLGIALFWFHTEKCAHQNCDLRFRCCGLKINLYIYVSRKNWVICGLHISRTPKILSVRGTKTFHCKRTAALILPSSTVYRYSCQHHLAVVSQFYELQFEIRHYIIFSLKEAEVKDWPLLKLCRLPETNIQMDLIFLFSMHCWFVPELPSLLMLS